MTEGVAGAIGQALREALLLRRPSQVLVQGSGTISIYPEQGCYVTDIADWEGLYEASDAQVRLQAPVWSAPPEAALPLTELRWRALVHDLYRAHGPDAVPGRELMRLLSWPDLPRLPDELLGPVTRLCALLWRKPTVGFLVARTLAAPPRQTAVLLAALQALGHVAGSGPAAPPRTDPVPAEEPELASEGPGEPVPGILGKLWQRLLAVPKA